MSVIGEGLFDLLPAALRRRDAESEGAVRALLRVLAEQIAVVEEDIERLNEDWFIETCAEWVVPYLGDLLGARGLHQVPGAAATSSRSRVANTLRFRRRKGTLAMLEQLARDATGWPAKAVEFFELLSTTQQLNHLRLHRPASAELRDAQALELLDGPFDGVAHTADTRRLGPERGWFNIPHIGLFVWPIGSYLLERAAVRPAADPDDGRYRVDILGADRPMFMPPEPETDIEHFAQEENVPGLLRRRPLYRELEALREPSGSPDPPRYFGARPVFRVFVAPNAGDKPEAVPAERVHVCNLTDWRRPTDAGHVNVDPVLGRISFPETATPDRVLVSHAYGAGGDVGGGSYSRQDGLAALFDRSLDWQVGVRTAEPGDPAEPDVLFADLVTAVAAWNAFDAAHPGSFGLITVLDNERYVGPLAGADGIRVGPGGKLAIVAARWPRVQVPGGPAGQTARRPGRVEPIGLRPCVAGPIEVLGTATAGQQPGELLLDGLLVDGALRVLGDAPANLGRLTVRDSSLVPAAGGVQVTAGNPELSVDLHRCLTGPITLPTSVRALTVNQSVVFPLVAGAADAVAVDAAGADVTVDRVTLLGSLTARSLTAGNALFTGVVMVERTQAGCVRFSYLPPGSVTPRRYRCQPDLAVEQSSAPAAQVRARLVPSFLSEDFGHFGAAYLPVDAPDGLLTGADDGAEMGVFGIVQRPQRLANLISALDEYLPFGLDATPLPVTPRSET